MNTFKKGFVIFSLAAAFCYCQFTVTEIRAEEISGEVVTTEYVTENVTAETPTEETVTEETTTKEIPTQPVIVNDYIVTKEGNVFKCTYSGVMQKKVYLAVLYKNGKYTVVAPKTKNSVIYYFDARGNGKKYTKTNIVSITYKKSSVKYYVKAGKIGTGWYQKKGNKYYYSSGTMVTGWKQIFGKKYYFSESRKNQGVLLKNTIVSTKKGSYYVDSQGVRVTSKEIKLAVKFVQAHTKANWSKEKKLKACYNYFWKNYSYQRFVDTPDDSKMSGYASYMLTYKRGNCYRYAAAFACIAKVIGYDSRVAVGQISAIGGGMTPHGWTEIKIGGKWYLFDANMQKNFPQINSYKQTNTSYKYRHTCSRRYVLKIKSGKVTWK